MAKEYIQLRTRIMETFGTYSNFADSLGVARQEVSAFLCGKRTFTMNTVVKWCEILGINKADIGKYFF